VRERTPIGPHEIAVMLNVSRQRVQQLMEKDDFPEPWAVLATGRIWAAEDVEAWGVKAGRRIWPVDTSTQDRGSGVGERP